MTADDFKRIAARYTELMHPGECQWRQLAALSHPADATLMQFIDSIKALCK
jgi:hypothetical protein